MRSISKLVLITSAFISMLSAAQAGNIWTVSANSHYVYSEGGYEACHQAIGIADYTHVDGNWSVGGTLIGKTSTGGRFGKDRGGCDEIDVHGGYAVTMPSLVGSMEFHANAAVWAMAPFGENTVGHFDLGAALPIDVGFATLTPYTGVIQWAVLNGPCDSDTKLYGGTTLSIPVTLPFGKFGLNVDGGATTNLMTGWTAMRASVSVSAKVTDGVTLSLGHYWYEHTSPYYGMTVSFAG